MNCTACNNPSKKFGKDRKGNQRFQCLTCKKTFTEEQQKPLGDMRIPMEKAVMILNLW